MEILCKSSDTLFAVVHIDICRFDTVRMVFGKGVALCQRTGIGGGNAEKPMFCVDVYRDVDVNSNACEI